MDVERCGNTMGQAVCGLLIGWTRQNDGTWVKGHNLSHRGMGISWSLGPNDFQKAATPHD